MSMSAEDRSEASFVGVKVSLLSSTLPLRIICISRSIDFIILFSISISPRASPWSEWDDIIVSLSLPNVDIRKLSLKEMSIFARDPSTLSRHATSFATHAR